MASRRRLNATQKLRLELLQQTTRNTNQQAELYELTSRLRQVTLELKSAEVSSLQLRDMLGQYAATNAALIGIVERRDAEVTRLIDMVDRITSQAAFTDAVAGRRVNVTQPVSFLHVKRDARLHTSDGESQEITAADVIETLAPAQDVQSYGTGESDKAALAASDKAAQELEEALDKTLTTIQTQRDKARAERIERSKRMLDAIPPSAKGRITNLKN